VFYISDCTDENLNLHYDLFLFTGRKPDGRVFEILFSHSSFGCKYRDIIWF
jgi:hypothetical protein